MVLILLSMPLLNNSLVSGIINNYTTKIRAL